MITTLKITTIFAAVVCISLVGFVGTVGLRGDPEIEKVLNGPRFLQEFKNLVTKAPSTEGQVSPLVKEAQIFALRIDPPPPPPPPEPVKTEKPVIPTPKAPAETVVAEVTQPLSRFDLIATCRYEDDTSKSMALLDLPGKGLKWFRVGENVEHLVVTEVLDGSITMSQSGRNPQTIAMKKEQPLARNLLLEEGQKLEIPASSAITYQPVTVPVTSSSLGKGNAYFMPEGGSRAPRTAASADTTAPGLSPLRKPPSTPIARQPRTYSPPTRPRTPAAEPTTEQRRVALDENIEDLKSILNQPNSAAPKEEAAEEQAALAKLLEILEEERKTAEQQSKVTSSDASKPKQGE